MMKRKVLLLLLVFAAILLCAGCALASETDPIVCSMELSPTKLAGPGTVNVTITISNSGDADMKDPVVLYDPVGKPVQDFGTNGAALLKAGESKTWTGTYDVNQRTLDNGTVIYFVKYTIYKSSGEAVETNQPIRGKISVQTAEADIEVKRTISPTVAREGQKVVVKYDITNSGTIDLTSITIQESKDIHKEKQTIQELKPGQTAEIEYSVTMGKKDLTSGATVTYKSTGNKKAQEYTVENQVITYGESALTAKLTASSKGVPINDKLTLTLELKNGGTLDYSDIRVTDPLLGDVFTNQQLAAGKSLTLEKEITLTATTEYLFTVTAIDSTGTETATATDPVTVEAVNPEDVLSLSLTATPDRTEVFEQPGLVRFSVVIANDSNVEAKNVAVSHGDTALYTFTSIPAGETRTLTRDTALSMAGKFRFTATAVDALGNKLTFESNEVQIAFSVPTPAPATATPPPVPTEEPTFSPVTMPPITNPSIGAFPKTVQSVLLPVLILSGLLLVASAVLLVIATKRRSDQRKASEAAYDHLERAKRRDYVTPAEEEVPEKPTEEKAQSELSDGASQPMEGRRTLLDDDDVDDMELPHIKYARSAAENRNPVPEDDFFAGTEGLYDEPPADDPNAYATQNEESTLYEQPGDQGGYDDEFYGESTPESPELNEEIGVAPYEQDYGSETDAYEGDDAQFGYGTSYDEDSDAYGSRDDAYGDGAYDDATVDGHMPDDRESVGGGAPAAYDDSAFRRPSAEPDTQPRAAGRRSRKERDTGLEG